MRSNEISHVLKKVSGLAARPETSLDSLGLRVSRPWARPLRDRRPARQQPARQPAGAAAAGPSAARGGPTPTPRVGTPKISAAGMIKHGWAP